MVQGSLIVTVLMLAALAGVLLRRRRPPDRSPHSVEVTRQHLHLFQGGRLSESELEAAKAAFRRHLQRGEEGRIEAGLQAGLRFAVAVRALADLGTPEAGDILERQLARRFSRDPVEQSWYRLDLANGLRRLNRVESLPALLQNFPAEEAPLRHYLAAEMVCFPGFAHFLTAPETATGQAALRVLHQALLGLRSGVQPHVVIEGRLGEAVELVWEQRHRVIEPTAVRVFAEALRLPPRAEHADRAFCDSRRDREAYWKQIKLIEDLSDAMADHLSDLPPALFAMLPAPAVHESAILRALLALKADTGAVIRPLLEADQITDRELAVESLANSTDSAVGTWLCEWAGGRRPTGFPRRAVLKVLRHFASVEAEALLLKGARDSAATIRVTALGSLGWWEPLNRKDVSRCLHAARHDTNATLRRAAESALARLGECQALQWFRQQFAGEQTDPVHHAIQLAADEGVLLLWPELDQLADAEDADVAYHACEALEQLRESCSFAASPR
ncbi:MAG: HEAT repeat domain-containing protein [Gemmataceae bacterium]